MEILICAGDPSGDIHASNLARELKKITPGCRISAIGGEKLRHEADNFIYDIVGLNVHGFWEPVKQYFRLKKFLDTRVADYLRGTKPSAVIPVDYYGFNIHLARTARELGIPVYYFISPQIWATRPKRIEKMKKYVNHISVIFPFEEKIYARAGVPVTFVGNPLLDSVPLPAQKQPGNPVKGNFTIGLFPGSRKQVIKWNLPVMIKSAKLILARYPGVKFKIIGMKQLEKSYGEVPVKSFEILYDSSYAARAGLDFAITTSGTVALENTLLEIPMVVMYRLPWLMYYLVKSIIKVTSVTITNLLVNEQIVPEYIQHDATPRKISDAVVKTISDANALNVMKQKLNSIRPILGQPGVYNRAAKLIMGKI